MADSGTIVSQRYIRQEVFPRLLTLGVDSGSTLEDLNYRTFVRSDEEKLDNPGLILPGQWPWYR